MSDKLSKKQKDEPVTETLPDAVTEWLKDGRETSEFALKASHVVTWAMRTRAKYEKEGWPSQKGVRWKGGDDMMIEAAIEGNAQFFRDLATAFESIQEAGWKVGDHGSLVSPPLKGVRVFFLDHWKEWERSGTKVEVRLAELRAARFQVADSQYHRYAAFLRKHYPSKKKQV